MFEPELITEQGRLMFEFMELYCDAERECIRLKATLKETRFWLQQYKEKYRDAERKLAAMGLVPTRSLCQQDWDLLEEELADWQDFVNTQLDAIR